MVQPGRSAKAGHIKIDNPAWEVMTVPETLTLEDFLAALRLWRWQRRMDGRLVEVPVA